MFNLFKKQTSPQPEVMGAGKQIIIALKDKVIPELRKNGFTGSYPHFLRASKEKIDLLSFQFNKYGGSFTIEISAAYPNRNEYKNFYLVGDKTINDLKSSNTFVRYRLGETDGDHWFEFNQNNIDEIIGQVLKLLPLAYQWWDNPPIMEKLEQRKKQGVSY